MHVFVHHKKKIDCLLFVVKIHIINVTQSLKCLDGCDLPAIYYENKHFSELGRVVTVLRGMMPCTLLPTFRRNPRLPPSTSIMAAVDSSETLVNNYHATLRKLFAGVPPRRPGFESEPVYFGFVVNKVALGQVFLEVLWLSPLIIIPQMLHTHTSFTYCGRHVTLATESLVR